MMSTQHRNGEKNVITDSRKQNDRARTALLVLCGLPASGKTSVAQALVLSAANAEFQALHICFDSLISSNMQAWQQGQAKEQSPAETSSPSSATSSINSSDQDNEIWQASRASSLSLIRSSLHSAATEATSLGLYTLVVADDNMQFRSMRHECYQLAAAEGAAYMQLYLPCTAQEAVARNRARTSEHVQVSEASILKMSAALQAPEPARFLWEEPTLCLASLHEQHALALTDNSQTNSSDSAVDSKNSNQCAKAMARIEPSSFHTIHMCEKGLSSTTHTLLSAIWTHWGRAAPACDSSEARSLQCGVIRAGQEVSRVATAASQLHKLDKDSRTLVASTMSAAAPSQQKQLAGLLHKERKALLDRARAGPLVLACTDKCTTTKDEDHAQACMDISKRQRDEGVVQQEPQHLSVGAGSAAQESRNVGGEQTSEGREVSTFNQVAPGVESSLVANSVPRGLHSTRAGDHGYSQHPHASTGTDDSGETMGFYEQQLALFEEFCKSCGLIG